MGIPKSDLLGVTVAVIHVTGQQSLHHVVRIALGTPVGGLKGTRRGPEACDAPVTTC